MSIEDVRKEAIEEIIRYQSYEQDWDGYDAKPFSSEAIETAKLIINKIVDKFNELQLEPDSIIPGPISDGRIDIEVIYKCWKLLIFTIDTEENTLEIYFSISGQEIENIYNKTLTYDINLIDIWIDKIVDENYPKMKVVAKECPEYIDQIMDILCDLRCDPDEIEHTLTCHSDQLPEWIKYVAPKIEKIKEILKKEYPCTLEWEKEDEA